MGQGGCANGGGANGGGANWGGANGGGANGARGLCKRGVTPTHGGAERGHGQKPTHSRSSSDSSSRT